MGFHYSIKGQVQLLCDLPLGKSSKTPLPNSSPLRSPQCIFSLSKILKLKTTQVRGVQLK